MGKESGGRSKWKKGWRRIRNPQDLPGANGVSAKSKRNIKFHQRNYEQDETLWRRFADYWKHIRYQLANIKEGVNEDDDTSCENIVSKFSGVKQKQHEII